MSASEYGRHYWWIKLANGQEMGVYSDRVEIMADGSLILYGGSTSLGSKFVNLAIAPGEWQIIYAADPEDGRPEAIEHWQKRK